MMEQEIKKDKAGFPYRVPAGLLPEQIPNPFSEASVASRKAIADSKAREVQMNVQPGKARRAYRNRKAVKTTRGHSEAFYKVRKRRTYRLNVFRSKMFSKP